MNKLINFYYLALQISKEKLLSAFSSFSTKIYFFISVLINTCCWAGSYYIAKSVGADQIALHYSVGFGIDYYSDTEKIYILPLLGLFVLILNFLMFTIIEGYKDKNFIGHILFSSSIAVNIILLISIFSIYIINF